MSSVASEATPTLTLARLVAIEGEVPWLEIAGRRTRARRDEAVHPVVLAGACERGERVLVEIGMGLPVVVGALRTQPTPGIDAAEAYHIEAEHVTVSASHKLTLRTRAAGLMLSAAGEVETYAERILSRASGVHKIVGRMLRLN